MSKFKFLKRMGIFSALALTIAGCGKFNPEENYPDEIYGPPEMLEDSIDEESLNSEKTGNTVDTLSKPTKAPSKNDASDEEEFQEEVVFEPVENVQQCIYGPPEMFQNN